MKKRLSERQKRFCDEYLISLNATQAAIKAGYSQKYAGQNADKLLKNPKIKAFISERLDKKEKTRIATQDEILEYFTRVMRGESQSAVLARTEEGAEHVIFKPPDEKERLKAAEQLGKRFGLNLEEIERQARIEKLKAETARIKGESPDENEQDDGFLDALRSEVQSVWEE